MSFKMVADYYLKEMAKASAVHLSISNMGVRGLGGGGGGSSLVTLKDLLHSEQLENVRLSK